MNDCEWPGCDKYAVMSRLHNGKKVRSCITHMEDFENKWKDEASDGAE